MATNSKSRKPAARSNGSLLSAPFRPGKDGVVYFYFWIKFMDRLPTAAKGASAHAALKSQAHMLIVDVDGSHQEAFAPFSFDLKQSGAKKGSGQFSVKWLPPGTPRKQAEAWIKSAEGKAWAGDYPTALSSFTIRVF